jgi:hypothetical protein
LKFFTDSNQCEWRLEVTKHHEIHVSCWPIENFKDDAPWESHQPWFEKVGIADQIEGVQIHRLHSQADDRGDLTVLFSQLDPNQQAIPPSLPCQGCAGFHPGVGVP